MKLCKRCGIEKDDGSFYKCAGMKCKDCTKSDVRENLKNVGDAYDKTEKGVIRVIHKTQKKDIINSEGMVKFLTQKPDCHHGYTPMDSRGFMMSGFPLVILVI